MTVAEGLNQVLEIKDNIKRAIESQGVSMVGASFDMYPERISQIVGSGGGGGESGGDDHVRSGNTEFFYRMTKGTGNKPTVNIINNGEGHGFISWGDGQFTHFEGKGEHFLTPTNALNSGNYYAFIECTTEYTLGGGYEHEYFFGDVTNMRSIVKLYVGENVSSLGNYAFISCNALQYVYIPKSVKTIGTNTFYMCSACREYDMTEYDEIPLLKSVQAFNNINPTCYMKVKDTLLKEFKKATNWSTFAPEMVGV